jgi:hypothetical protein
VGQKKRWLKPAVRSIDLSAEILDPPPWFIHRFQASPSPSPSPAPAHDGDARALAAGDDQ